LKIASLGGIEPFSLQSEISLTQYQSMINSVSMKNINNGLEIKLKFAYFYIAQNA